MFLGVQRKRELRAGVFGAITVGLLATAAMPAQAASYSVVHSFTGMTQGDGEEPSSALVADSQGRLYGTTFEGGQFGQGSVYRLTKTGKTWTEEVLFSFPSTQAGPQGGVLIGPAGELYGTTQIGGNSISGSVWRLVPNGTGWTFTVLHEFNQFAGDGFYPRAGLTFGKDGLIYGTTNGIQPQDGQGASMSPMYGTVFSVSPQGDTVQYARLHVFGGPNDGQFPQNGRLSIDRRGVITGTTALGGTGSDGIAYQLTPPKKTGGAWKETILHNFGAAGDAVGPMSGVVQGKDGAFYGCATWGKLGAGAVFQLAPNGTTWGESLLYNFGSQTNDPYAAPFCTLTIDASGRLFGAANNGGVNLKGAFFRVDPPASGQTAWTETVLHSFGASGDAAQPSFAPVRVGKVYLGVANLGGADGKGAVYAIKP
jgi:uncharacterized repeat protein (TIGR03803 family)